VYFRTFIVAVVTALELMRRRTLSAADVVVTVVSRPIGTYAKVLSTASGVPELLVTPVQVCPLTMNRICTRTKTINGPKPQPVEHILVRFVLFWQLVSSRTIFDLS
jgi:hypothetical protein